MDTRVNKGEKISKELKKKEKQEKKERKKIKRKHQIKRLFIFIFLLVGLIIIYSKYIEPNILIVKENKISSKNIPDSFDGIKIVHFSDLHYGSSIDKNNINKYIDKINNLKPDIVIFTGDLIEEDYQTNDNDIKILTNSLNNINYNLGKYIIYGNHDYYNENFINIINNTNFKLLVNDYDIIYNKSNDPILIYGLDDTLYGNPDLTKLNDNNISNINYKIVLTHEGDYSDKILDYNANLILAGHSHNGQINLPYLINLYLPDGAKKYYKPYYNINNTDIYINNGLGTNKYDIRLFSIPSINLYRLKKISK